MCEGIHIHICKESDTTEHAHKGIKHACTCVRVRAHTRNLPGKDGLTCEIHRPLENMSRHNHKEVSAPETLR